MFWGENCPAIGASARGGGDPERAGFALLYFIFFHLLQCSPICVAALFWQGALAFRAGRVGCAIYGSTLYRCSTYSFFAQR
jgi:hypothetical protein